MSESTHPDATDDALYEQAKTLVVAQNEASVALVQRHLRLGYGRACALFERMQAQGIVTPMPGVSHRWTLVKEEAQP